MTTRSGTTAFTTFNGAAARAFLYERAAKKLTPLAGFPMEGERKAGLDDQRGRVFKSFTGRRSAAEPPTDPEKELERRFVGMVASCLNDLKNAGAFDRLIVAATPRALGYWREVAPKALAAVVLEELAADYVNSDDQTMLETVENALYGE